MFPVNVVHISSCIIFYKHCLKNTHVICTEKLFLLNCTFSCCPYTVVLLVFATGFLSSTATVVVTTAIVCLVKQKRRSRWPKDLKNTTPSPVPVYVDITETTVKKEIIEMTSNVAYASAE